MKDTFIVYFDETGNDGNNTNSSSAFLLTSIYMFANDWQNNYNILVDLRKKLKEKYGFHINEEMHTPPFLCDKDLYRNYNWSIKQKQVILKEFQNVLILILLVVF